MPSLNRIFTKLKEHRKSMGLGVAAVSAVSALACVLLWPLPVTDQHCRAAIARDLVRISRGQPILIHYHRNGFRYQPLGNPGYPKVFLDDQTNLGICKLVADAIDPVPIIDSSDADATNKRDAWNEAGNGVATVTDKSTFDPRTEGRYWIALVNGPWLATGYRIRFYRNIFGVFTIYEWEWVT